MKNIAKSLIIYFICAALIGIYTIIINWIGLTYWKDKIQGSLIKDASGEIKGSFLLGQEFARPQYFRGRPKNLIKDQCNLQFYTSPYKDIIKNEIEINKFSVKYPELIVPSYSLLDPYISLKAALAQVPLIAKLRGISEIDLEHLVYSHTMKASRPFFEMDIVNIVKLNRAL